MIGNRENWILGKLADAFKKVGDAISRIGKRTKTKIGRFRTANGLSIALRKTRSAKGLHRATCVAGLTEA
jgi:hypothetical protein